MTKKGQLELASAPASSSRRRRAVRHRGADRRGAGAGRVRAELHLVRVFLARAARPDLRDLHRHRDPLKGIVSLLLGLADRRVGIDPAAGFPRFTFGSVELMQGIGLIPAMIGMFAVSEIMRNAVDDGRARRCSIDAADRQHLHRPVAGVAHATGGDFIRGIVIGTLIGALPGAGADIAAWISYAVSKSFSKEPEKFGTGHIEGIVDSSSANNSALAGAWIPALVFGIPGDSITAIVIGVLYMKSMNPGRAVHCRTRRFIYAVFIIFAREHLHAPARLARHQGRRSRSCACRDVLMPIILLFCVVGSFAMTNIDLRRLRHAGDGRARLRMEETASDRAAILGLVLGEMFEQNFVTSMIKSDGSLLASSSARSRRRSASSRSRCGPG